MISFVAHQMGQTSNGSVGSVGAPGMSPFGSLTSPAPHYAQTNGPAPLASPTHQHIDTNKVNLQYICSLYLSLDSRQEVGNGWWTQNKRKGGVLFQLWNFSIPLLVQYMGYFWLGKFCSRKSRKIDKCNSEYCYFWPKHKIKVYNRHMLQWQPM